MIDITRRIGEDPEVMIDIEMIEEIDLVAEMIKDTEETQVKTETGEEKEIQVKTETGGEEEILVKIEIVGEEDQEVLIGEKVEDLSYT